MKESFRIVSMVIPELAGPTAQGQIDANIALSKLAQYEEQLTAVYEELRKLGSGSPVVAEHLQSSFCGSNSPATRMTTIFRYFMP